MNDAFATGSLTFLCFLSLQHRGLEQLMSSVQRHAYGAGFHLVPLTQLLFFSHEDYRYQLLHIKLLVSLQLSSLCIFKAHK